MQTTQEKVFKHNTLNVSDSEVGANVVGSAITYDKEVAATKYYLSVTVTSYTYERHGEKKRNHVPSVILAQNDGRIVRSPSARDSSRAERAIRNGLSVARAIYTNLEEYVQ